MTASGPAAKRCTKCGQPKPPEEFYKDPRKADGRQSECKTCTRSRRHQHDEDNREAVKARMRARYAADPEAQREWHRSYYRESPDRRAANKASGARHRQSVRKVVFDYYGWSCTCCGTTENPSIDHVDGSGSAHREELSHLGGGNSTRLYGWLIRNGFPEGFQTLCKPCNTSKGGKDRCRIHDQCHADCVAQSLERAPGPEGFSNPPGSRERAPGRGHLTTLITENA